VEQRKGLQHLTYLSGGAVVTLVLLVAAGNLGIAGIVLNLLVAVPIAYVHMRFGTVPALSAVALVATGGFLMSGVTGLLSYLLQFGLLAVLLPGLMRRRWAWDRAVAATVAGIMLVSFLVLAVYASSTGETVASLVDTFATAEAEQAMAIYAAADLPSEQVAELQPAVEQMADFIRYAYPGLATTITGFLALLVLWMLNALSRGDYTLPGPRFAAWKANELLVWPLIAAGFAFTLAEGELQQLSMNLLIILMPVYFVQGLAIVTHFFNRRQIPPFMRGLGYILIAVLNPMPLIITGIGVFDLWIDFRKPRIKTT